ncbi:MAG: hypothetical protein AABN34_03250 [Acidobacteriota bacterium]
MSIRICVVVLCLTGVASGQAGASSSKRGELERPDVIATTGLVSTSPTAAADAQPSARPLDQREFRLLATNKTSTMQKEMNEAADTGFHFEGTMGGETSFGGSEVVVIMSRDPSAPKKRYDYKLLATSKTSTMQKELQQAGNAGFEFKGQSVYSSTFGGKEVVVILERDLEAKPGQWEYKLLATKKTSTMQKELNEAGAEGFVFVGVTVGDTLVGGKEVVSILRRPSLK